MYCAKCRSSSCKCPPARSHPLREVAGRLSKLSYRDLRSMAAGLLDGLQAINVPAGYESVDTICDALLTWADGEGKEADDDEDC